MGERDRADGGGGGTGSFPRPTVVISQCLEFEPVRWDGQRIPFDFVRELEPWVQYRPVCPEVEIGLGVPRDPIRLVEGARRLRLVQPATGRDVTDEMTAFSRTFLDGLGAVDGFILKNRSPSCGTVDVKVYPPSEGASPSGRGPGVFGGAVLERFGDLAIENEGRLRNYRIREHFLTKLFALARLRNVVRSGKMRELVGFQARYKYVLMGYDQEAGRRLGRIVANHDGRPFARVVEAYRETFARALSSPPRPSAMTNVFQHVAGYFSDDLSREEKDYFQDLVRRYRETRLPVGGVSSVLHAWAVRFGTDYLLNQAFFEPFPEALRSLSDSGKGRVG